MLHGFNFSKLGLLSTLIFTYSNASNSQLLPYQGPTYTVGVRRIPCQTDSADVTCSRSCDQGKITKRNWKIIRVEKNPHKKILKINKFCSFKKNTKPHSELFLLHHAASPFAELHNINLLYLLWHSNLRIKECAPSFFRKVLLVNSFQSDKAWQECAQQTEKSHSHTNSAVSRQVYIHALLFQHLYTVYFFNIWFGMV